MKHINVSVFVPHAGCPHQCSFCNQRSISGAKSQPTAQDVRDAALVAMRSSPEGIKDGEIAFFGGSFTAIDRDYMIELLSSAQEFIGENGFKGIRISTRPDAVDGEICDILEKYHVTAVELGAQSTNDKVLAMNRRGHTREDIFRSARLLKERGFELGLQMMTGLYGSNDEDSIGTARDIISLLPGHRADISDGCYRKHGARRAIPQWRIPPADSRRGGGALREDTADVRKCGDKGHPPRTSFRRRCRGLFRCRRISSGSARDVRGTYIF